MGSFNHAPNNANIVDGHYRPANLLGSSWISRLVSLKPFKLSSFIFPAFVTKVIAKVRTILRFADRPSKAWPLRNQYLESRIGDNWLAASLVPLHAFQYQLFLTALHNFDTSPGFCPSVIGRLKRRIVFFNRFYGYWDLRKPVYIWHIGQSWTVFYWNAFEHWP